MKIPTARARSLRPNHPTETDHAGRNAREGLPRAAYARKPPLSFLPPRARFHFPQDLTALAFTDKKTAPHTAHSLMNNSQYPE